MYKKGMFLILLLSFVLAACNSNDGSKIVEHMTHNPTPAEILSDDNNADIFLEGDVVYKNAKAIEWVNGEALTTGKEVGEINK